MLFRFFVAASVAALDFTAVKAGREKIMSEMWTSNTDILIGTLIRLSVAIVCGGIIGIERGVKRRPAGFRTHMMVCLGAALTMMLGQFIAVVMTDVTGTAVNSDVSRIGAQVINGIGFLGAGTIIVTGRQQVKGLTTAAGLWAAACMGLAIGAGFYFGALVACVFIILTTTLFSRLEAYIVSRARNMNIYAEFYNIDDLGEIIARIKSMEVRIYDIEIQKKRSVEQPHPGAVFSLGLPKKMPHTAVITALAGIENIRAIEEL